MPYINVDEAYILNNTGLQVDNSVDYANANSNRNLLDNPFFTVNQRNASGTIAQGGYPADRWINENTGSCTRNNDGTISVNGSSNYVLFRQKQTADYMSALVGKTVTFSYLTSGGSIVAKTMTIAASTQNIAYISANGYMCVDTRSNANSTFILFRDSQTIRAVKLELGSYSTLINDVPPDYNMELMKCEHRCVVYDLPGNFLFCRGVATSATNIAGIIDLPRDMAEDKTPTVSITGSLVTAAGNAITAIAAATYARKNKLRVNLTGTGFTSGTVYDVITGNSTPKIVISADL